MANWLNWLSHCRSYMTDWPSYWPITDCLTASLTWLTDLLTDCLTVSLTWLTDCLTNNWLTDCLTVGLTWLTDCLTHWLTDCLTDSLTWLTNWLILSFKSWVGGMEREKKLKLNTALIKLKLWESHSINNNQVWGYQTLIGFASKSLCATAVYFFMLISFIEKASQYRYCLCSNSM